MPLIIRKPQSLMPLLHALRLAKAAKAAPAMGKLPRPDIRPYRIGWCNAPCVKILLLFWLPVVVWMSFIFRCSAIPGSNIPSLFAGQDILFHAGVYMILALLFSRALAGTKCAISPSLVLGWAVLFCLLYGISDELHQLFVPNRSCDFFDILVDLSGAAAGSILYRWLLLNRSKR